MDKQPACLGKWELFDSPFPEDHMEAVELCRVCPMIVECEQLLEQVSQLEPSWCGPVGTWAGRHISRVTRRRQAVCGTESGYARHRKRLGEEPCEACHAAHKEAARRRSLRAQSRRETAA